MVTEHEENHGILCEFNVKTILKMEVYHDVNCFYMIKMLCLVGQHEFHSTR